MAFTSKGISPEKFYGKKTARQEKIEAIIKNNNSDDTIDVSKKPKFMNQLLGPSLTWKIFKKQQDAIETCMQRRNGLMAFAFEDINARRMFLVAHPKVFWSLNYYRFFKSCSTYEIIQEHAACKLYLDLEFHYEFNKNHNGENMVSNFLKVINYNLKHYFHIICSKDDILELDSSSEMKFSRHIIYEIKNIAFRDNYLAGHFVKVICNELRQAYEDSLANENEKLSQLSTKYNLKSSDLLEFFIYDNKGKVKMFVDEGVYTKNRHFRLFGSSKQFKNIPLVPSQNNKYKPIDSDECSMFLDSLITFFSWEVDRVLDSDKLPWPMKSIGKCAMNAQKREGNMIMNSTQYPEIDSFINTIIAPNGKIRKKYYFSDTFKIVYEIQGYRYCDNIKREHKSNNIKYIVDCENLTYYQKCFDPDCADFRSNLISLPLEIRFLYESDESFSFFEASEEAGKFKDFINGCDFKDWSCEQSESGITDEELMKVADCVEGLLDVEW